MFWTDLLSIIRSLNTVFTAIGTCICHTSYVGCLLVRPEPRQQTLNITNMTNTNCCEYNIKTSDDGQYVCLKHVEFFTKIKLRNSASFWLLL